MASGCQEESRLLRGKTLRDAQAWAKGKNLSYQDRQFLAASDKKEIEEQIAQQKLDAELERERKDREAELERERKEREAAEKRNQALTEANRKAKWRVRLGSAVLIVAVLGTVISGILAGSQVKEANRQVKEADTNVDRKSVV